MFKKVLVLLLGILLIIFGILRLKRDKAVEEPGYLKFMNGNSLVKENKTKEALEEYKLAMDTNEDINIKKNFEIIKNKVDEEKQNQQQDNQQNQDQDQKNNENQQQNQQQDQQDKNNSQDNNKQNDQKNNEQNNKDKKDDQQNNQKQDENQNKKDDNNNNQQQNQQENQNDSQNNEPNKGSTPKELTPEEKAMKQKEEELRSIMQRLEGNEKQAFKNNERVLNTSENKNSENRW
ncbi:hypothetical protein [uncultured Cetobacterium sp.]|uniref:hypothetical protein n=1 Tax=uncultured Cetobacterium sp. TaxID=527638 RepID=UPI00260A56E9|nr:hypothetical protein [uncultured Cetobacterium sp.]